MYTELLFLAAFPHSLIQRYEDAWASRRALEVKCIIIIIIVVVVVVVIVMMTMIIIILLLLLLLLLIIVNLP